MKRRWMLAVLVLLPGLARAQQPVTSPHGELDMACESCHSAEGWSPARLDRFDHAATGFDLAHAHAALACADCHHELEFGLATRDCVGCHTDVHLGELGQDCGRCHTARSFLDLARHRELHREADFALTGAHAGADCESCHPPGALGDLQYLATPSECHDCHRGEYLATTDPDHASGGFLLACEVCHSTAAWEDAFFNHEEQLAGSVPVCVDCHQDDYDRASRPDHAGIPFPLDCERCHGTRSWTGSYFEHDGEFFPIFTGRHAGEWRDCSECHPGSSGFDTFTCLSCHPHSDRAKTDADHDEEAEYAYDSIECLRCHPDGSN